jgi:hypothetical protein
MRLALILLLCACTSCGAGTSERDGSTPDKAIIVPAGLGDREVSWEMAQARRLYPDANLGDAVQGLVPYKGRLLDAYEFHTSSGKQINVFFDIGPDKKP